MNIYLPSMTDEELSRYASQNAVTDLELELAKRLVVADDECGIADDVCQCCGNPS